MTSIGNHNGLRSGTGVFGLSLSRVARLLGFILGNPAKNAKEAIARMEVTKVLIANAITAKGGTVNPTDNFEFDYATRIGEIPSGSSSGWNPDADWEWDAAAAQIDDGDDAFVGAFAVGSGFDCNLSLRFYFDGSGLIDWGDGSAAEAVTSGVAIQHTFNYAGISSAVTSRGFKLAKILFAADSNFTNFSVRKFTGEQDYQADKLIAMKFRTTTAGRFTYNFTDDNAQMVELLDFGTIDLNLDYLFYNHRNLKKVTFKFGSDTSPTYMAYFGGPPDIDWNSLDFSNFTDMSQMFAYSYRAEAYALNVSLLKSTTLYACFRQQFYFTEVNFTETSLVADIAYAIYNSPIQSFEMDDCSSVTSTTGFVYTAGTNQKLKRLILTGLTVGIDISNQPMSATALDAFFTSLGTASGSQTITITGCLGAATCDTSIATGKGFTVVSS